MIVVDASIVVEFLLGSEIGRGVEERFLREGERLHAPALLDVEVLQVLRRMVRGGRLADPHGAALVEILGATPITRHTMEPLLPRVWALRNNLTAYDAAYVALGEALNCPLMTMDARIADATGPQIEIVVPG